MSSGNSGLGVNMDGLRERLPSQPEAPIKAANADSAQDAVKILNEQEASEEKDEKDKKTFGRTPDGTGAYNPPSAALEPRTRGIATIQNQAKQAHKPSSLALSHILCSTNNTDAVTI